MRSCVPIRVRSTKATLQHCRSGRLLARSLPREPEPRPRSLHNRVVLAMRPSLFIQNKRPAIVNPLEHRMKAPGVIPRPIDHWQAQDSARQVWVTHDRLFYLDLVVGIIPPRDHLFDHLDLFRWVGLGLGAEWGFLREWHRVGWTVFQPMQNSASTINVALLAAMTRRARPWNVAISSRACAPEARMRSTTISVLSLSLGRSCQSPKMCSAGRSSRDLPRWNTPIGPFPRAGGRDTIR